MSLMAGGRYKGTLHNHIYQRITPRIGRSVRDPSKPRKAKSVKQAVKEEVIRHLSGSGYIGGKGVPLRQQRVSVFRARRGPVRKSPNQERHQQFMREFFANHSVAEYGTPQARMVAANAAYQAAKRG